MTPLMQREVAGVVIDGSFRDSPVIARLATPDFHCRPSAPANLTLLQAPDIEVPIGCGEVVFRDGGGVVVLPLRRAGELAVEALQMAAFEDFVEEQAHQGRSILGLCSATEKRTEAGFTVWRKANCWLIGVNQLLLRLNTFTASLLNRTQS